MAGIKLHFTGITPEELIRNIERAAKTEILVGIPQAESARNDVSISNAEIAAIQERGDPANRLPPRPFIVPGIERVADQVTKIMGDGSQAVMAGAKLRPYAEKIGLLVQASIRGVFTENNWKALSPVTIYRRAYKRVVKRLSRAGKDAGDLGKMYDLVQKEIAAMGEQRPLIDTGQLRQSISYVVKEGE